MFLETLNRLVGKHSLHSCKKRVQILSVIIEDFYLKYLEILFIFGSIYPSYTVTKLSIQDFHRKFYL